MASVFESLLNESPAHAQTLARQWRANMLLVRKLWHDCARVPLTTALQQADAIVMPDDQSVAAFISSAPRATKPQGIVLLTIHMGNYLYSILRILNLIPRPRTVFVLRKKSWSALEQNAFNKIDQLGHTIITVRHGPAAARKIAAALRNGDIVILLYDLSRRWGETIPVDFLGTRMHWVTGPLRLSMLGRSIVFPFYSYAQGDRWHCDWLNALDYREPCKHVAEEIQRTVAIVEPYIRRYPGQWNHWQLIPEMLPDEGISNP